MYTSGICEIFTCIVHKKPGWRRIVSRGISSPSNSISLEKKVSSSVTQDIWSDYRERRKNGRIDDKLIRPMLNSRGSVSYQRYIVKLSRYKVDDPLAPRPSTWKLATIAPNAHPRENAEFTVRLMGDSTPSNHTD